MNKTESIVEIAKALVKFQAEVKQPLKDKTNPHYRSQYVPLENVVESVTETASKYGLSFIQMPQNNGDQVGIVTLLMHESGEWIETDPIFVRPQKQDPQGIGSAITYLKRYSLSALFGITSDEDDDANNASMPNNFQQQGGYQQQYRQTPSQQQQSNGASDAQRKAMKAKLSNVSKATGIDMQEIYVQTLRECKIPETLHTNQLSKKQASEVINALAAKEPQVQ